MGPDPPTPEKSQDIGFLRNTDPDPPKITKIPSQCWAVIGTQAKSHFGGPLLVVFGSPHNKKKKKVVKCGPPLNKLSGSAHAAIVLCLFLTVP